LKTFRNNWNKFSVFSFLFGAWQILSVTIVTTTLDSSGVFAKAEDKMRWWNIQWQECGAFEQRRYIFDGGSIGEYGEQDMQNATC
jgi:hypothetical protein